MNTKIEETILEIIKELNESFEIKELEQPTIDSPLYGPNGVLSSIELVMLVAEIEGVISDNFDVDIILADEKAMSQKISPFRSARSLAVYIEKLIQEEK